MNIYVDQIFLSVRQSLARSLGFEKRAAESLFERHLFANGPILPKPSQILSSYSIGSVGAVSNYTWLYRSSGDLVSAIMDQCPESSLSFIGDFFSGRDMSLVYQASGLIQLRYPFIGIAKIRAAFESLASSKAIGDKPGVLIDRLRCLSGGAYIIGGSSVALFRPLSMIRIASHASLQSLMGRVCSALGVVGSAFFALYSAIVAAVTGVHVQERISFIQELDRSGDLSSQIAWLQSQFEVNSSEIQQKLIEKHGEEKAKEILIDEAMASGKERVKAIIKELGIPSGQGEKLEETVRSAIRKSCWGWSSEAIECRVNEKLMLVGLSMRIKKTQLKHGKKIKRILGRGGLAAMKEVANLHGRVSATDEQVRKLVNEVRFSAITQNRKSLVTVAILTLGFITIIASLALTAGIPLIVAAGLSISAAILSSGFEIYNLYKSYKSEAPCAHDKKLMWLMLAIGIISLATLMLLGAFEVVALGPVAIIAAAVLTALWLGQSGAALWVVDRNERRQLLKNPTLESFIKAFDDKRMQGKVEEIFVNLPEEIRNQIQEILSSHGNDKKRAALSVARRIEELKVRQLEMLRTALAPHLAAVQSRGFHAEGL